MGWGRLCAHGDVGMMLRVCTMGGRLAAERVERADVGRWGGGGGKGGRCGAGVYKWKDGREYNGDWKDDKQHGRGACVRSPLWDMHICMFVMGYAHTGGSDEGVS